MSAKPVQICETLLRDAHQSLLATRMRTDDMLPIAEALDKVGYWSLEVWGGATFDSAMRFLNEDPWERLRMLRRAMPKHPLPDAAARPEPGRLQALSRRRRRAFRRPGAQERHRRLPHLRRPQRHAQHGLRHEDRQARRRPRPGGDLLHHLARCTTSRGSSGSARSWPTWAPTPSASRTWPACSRPMPPTTWSRRSRRTSGCPCNSTPTTPPAWARRRS